MYLYIFTYVFVCVHMAFANTHIEIFYMYLYKNDFSSPAKQTVIRLVINSSRIYSAF